MTRKLIAVLGFLTVALPALADDAPYYDEQSGAWTNDSPAPPPEQTDPQYAPPGPDGNVDVSVDMGAPGASVTLNTFQEPLAQYGQWVSVGTYGRVWRPTHVAAGWRPYFYGRWEWTDEGWLWVSDEPWGWAAYHYGRWANDPYYGWVWIPGTQWAPAWVTWRYSPEYIGWAPLGPGFSVYVTNYPAVYSWWTFVPCRRFVGVPIHTVAYTGGYVRGIFHGTQPAPPRAAVYGARAPAWGGPARPFVEQRIGHGIAPVRVQPVASPAAIRGVARPGVVPVYRPETRMPSMRPAPAQPAAPARAQGPAPAPAGRAWNQGGGAPAAGFRAAPAPGATPSARPAPGNAASFGSPRQQQSGPAPDRSAQGAFGPVRAAPQQRPAPAAPVRPQGGAAGPARPAQVRPPAPAAAPAPARPQGFAPPARSQAFAGGAPQRAPAFAAGPSRAPAVGRAHAAPHRP